MGFNLCNYCIDAFQREALLVCYFNLGSPFILYSMKFSLITIYDSNDTSKLLSCKGIHGFNEIRSFMYTQFYYYTQYKITYKYYKY